MTTTLEQAVSQIQQELLTIRAQIASRGQTSEAARETDNLTTAQAHEDALNPIDVNSQGRPKEFPGKEEDFQQWSRELQAFLAGEIRESEMVLEWAADQTMEITTTAIDLDFLPTGMNGGRGVRNLEFILQHMHESLMTLTSQEADDIVANSRKNTLEAWRRLHERYDPTDGGRKRNILRAINSPGRYSLQELQAGIERWESKVVRYEKLKGKLDDEIKRAGLESLVPEELELHLIFNSTRLETFEDARSEIVNFLEEKFGLIIRDFKPSEVSLRKSSDSTDFDVVSSLLSGKGKWSSDSRSECFKGRQNTFSTKSQCNQEHGQANVWQRQSEQIVVHE